MIYFVDDVGPSPLAQNVMFRDLPLRDVGQHPLFLTIFSFPWSSLWIIYWYFLELVDHCVTCFQVLFVSERTVIGVGFDCNPMVFAADERGVWYVKIQIFVFLRLGLINVAGPTCCNLSTRNRYCQDFSSSNKVALNSLSRWKRSDYFGSVSIFLLFWFVFSSRGFIRYLGERKTVSSGSRYGSQVNYISEKGLFNIQLWETWISSWISNSLILWISNMRKLKKLWHETSLI